MATDQPNAGNPPGKPEPVAFSLTLPRQNYDGTIAVRPYVGGPQLIALDVALGPAHVASAALTEEAALDVALRLVRLCCASVASGHDASDAGANRAAPARGSAIAVWHGRKHRHAPAPERHRGHARLLCTR